MRKKKNNSITLDGYSQKLLIKVPLVKLQTAIISRHKNSQFAKHFPNRKAMNMKCYKSKNFIKIRWKINSYK